MLASKRSANRQCNWSAQHLIEHGFAVIAGVFRREEVEAFKAALGDDSIRRSRAGARHILHHPAIARLAEDPRLIQTARLVLGAEVRPYRATLFDKSPTSNWLVVWHQDTALPLRERHELAGWGPWSVKGGITYARAPAAALEEILALRVHLDDSTVRNGPLRVLPGTNSLGVLSDDAIEKLTSEIRAVDCVVDAGGIVAMRPLLVHASSKSEVEQPRRVLHIEYAARMAIAGSLELAQA